MGSARAFNETLSATFVVQVAELNERFRRARAPLNYHNGFIQVATDNLIETNIAKPFLDLVADPLWGDVDIDMKEALVRRGENEKDPALFVAKALEGAIKIMSKKKGLTHGSEKGASDYIDNMVSKANGGFLSVWEGDMLRDYFSKVRIRLVTALDQPRFQFLTAEKTDWATETAMSWVRTLIRRM